jgi:hypothetical protein
MAATTVEVCVPCTSRPLYSRTLRVLCCFPGPQRFLDGVAWQGVFGLPLGLRRLLQAEERVITADGTRANVLLFLRKAVRVVAVVRCYAG